MDYIKREDAKILLEFAISDDWDLDYALQRFELDLPSADVVERKKGKWVEVGGFATPGGDPVWCCSECLKGRHVWGIEHSTYGGDIADNQWVACPNCGADMREE